MLAEPYRYVSFYSRELEPPLTRQLKGDSTGEHGSRTAHKHGSLRESRLLRRPLQVSDAWYVSVPQRRWYIWMHFVLKLHQLTVYLHRTRPSTI